MLCAAQNNNTLYNYSFIWNMLSWLYFVMCHCVNITDFVWCAKSRWVDIGVTGDWQWVFIRNTDIMLVSWKWCWFSINTMPQLQYYFHYSQYNHCYHFVFCVNVTMRRYHCNNDQCALQFVIIFVMIWFRILPMHGHFNCSFIEIIICEI